MAHKKLVLVVEDEAIIRMEAVQMLEDAGFNVVEASNASDAIGLLEARTDICAVFTDINMPGTLDGLKLARAIRGRWPPIHLILTSGLVSPNEQDLPSNGRFIQKPYKAEHVIATLRELLDQSPQPEPLRTPRKAA
jgi:CheY-like chemotaxis protein